MRCNTFVHLRLSTGTCLVPALQPVYRKHRAHKTAICSADKWKQLSGVIRPPKTNEACILQGSAAAAIALVSQLTAAAPAFAEDIAAYDASGSSETLKNVFGAAYVAVLIGFGIRLLSKRSKWATTERLASSSTDEDMSSATSSASPSAPAEPLPKPSPFAALYGAAQAGFITVVLFTLVTQLDGYFAQQTMPGGYTARNITTAIRTIIAGLAYLLTFLFAANAVGLTGLAIQLLLYPDADIDKPPSAPRPGADLPKVSLTDDIGDIRRAFAEIERQSLRDQRLRVAAEQKEAEGRK